MTESVARESQHASADVGVRMLDKPDKVLHGWVLPICTCCKGVGLGPPMDRQRIHGSRSRSLSSVHSCAQERLTAASKFLDLHASETRSRWRWTPPERLSLEELRAASLFAQHRCDQHCRQGLQPR